MATDPIILAEDILFEIMTMLPVKSLCRFKCVSKFWLRTISDDPKFVTAHLAKSKSRPKLLIIISTLRNLRSGEHSKSFYSIDYPPDLADDDDDDSDVIRKLHATAHGSINNCAFNGITSVCSPIGLICCTCYPGIRIGNPITGDFDLIQYPLINDTTISDDLGSNPCYLQSYLGFDSVDINRQVLLKLTYQVNDSHSNSSVFCLQERQWHNTPDPRPKPFDVSGKSSIYINGVIYIFAIRGNVHHCLYAFDVRLEHFEIIHLPPEPVSKLLTEYKGRPALIGSPVRGYVIKLWILEDSKKHSWNVKSFAIPWKEIDDVKRCIPVIFGANRGELIIGHRSLRQGSFALFLYAIETNTLRRFQVDGLVSTSIFEAPTSEEMVRVQFLIESLYSPKRSN